MNHRGFFEIGVYHPKTEHNIGTLWRSAMQLGASGIFTIGARYKRQASDTTNTMLHIPMRTYASFEEFNAHRPRSALLIGVEFGGRSLSQYGHPQQAVYLLGAEDHGLPPEIKGRCQSILTIESIGPSSYNVAVAGSILMYHRQIIRGAI